MMKVMMKGMIMTGLYGTLGKGILQRRYCVGEEGELTDYRHKKPGVRAGLLSIMVLDGRR